MEPGNEDSNEPSPVPASYEDRNPSPPLPVPASYEDRNPSPPLPVPASYEDRNPSPPSPVSASFEGRDPSPPSPVSARYEDRDPSPPSPVPARYEDRNPSPPPNDEVTPAVDSIGSTVYSKQWVFSTLTRLIEFVEKKSENVSEEGEEAPEVLDKDLEDDLCKVWDMSMNEEVALFLKEFEVPDLFIGIIDRSKSNRLTEICMGILANMCCFAETREMITDIYVLWEMLLTLFSDPDPRTLIEASRLLVTCLSHSDVLNIWMYRIQTQPSLRDNICFIMCSSTNDNLLNNVGSLVDKLFDLDIKLMIKWVDAPSQASFDGAQNPVEFGSPQLLFVPSWLEAVKQLRTDGSQDLSTYLHILHLLTTVDQAFEAIEKTPDGGESTWDFLSDLLINDLCQPEDPPLIVQEEKTMLCSVMSVLSMMFIGRSEQEFMKIDKNLPLINRTMQVLNHVDLYEENFLEECKKKRTEEDAKRLLMKDVSLRIFKDICCEFLADLLSTLEKENVTECFQKDYLSESKCCKAIGYMAPLFRSKAYGFVDIMSEVDPNLAETLHQLLPPPSPE